MIEKKNIDEDNHSRRGGLERRRCELKGRHVYTPPPREKRRKKGVITNDKEAIIEGIRDTTE